jgi:hypothetical protein
LRVALKFCVAEVEEEVPERLRWLRWNKYPVGRTLLEKEVTCDLVELSPDGCEATEPALTAVPTFVIDYAEAITTRAREANREPLGQLESREEETVGTESEDHIGAIDRDCRLGSIRVGIPVTIQLREHRFHGCSGPPNDLG